MKLPKLNLWLAVDKDYLYNNNLVHNILFLYRGKPIKRELENSICFISEGNERNFGRILSAKLLNLEGDYNPHRLYVLKKRHRKSTRAFWIAKVGYNKYIVTNHFPIKNINDEKPRFFGKVLLFIDDFKCEPDIYWEDSAHCKTCSKQDYCAKINEKNQFQFKKIYFYFIKNYKRVFL